MADLFSDEWMKGYMDAWNNESELSDALAEIDFCSVIGYGFQGDDAPTGVMTVENGKAVSAGAYNGSTTHTGCKTILRVKMKGERHNWEPLDDGAGWTFCDQSQPLQEPAWQQVML